MYYKIWLPIQDLFFLGFSDHGPPKWGSSKLASVFRGLPLASACAEHLSSREYTVKIIRVYKKHQIPSLLKEFTPMAIHIANLLTLGYPSKNNDTRQEAISVLGFHLAQIENDYDPRRGSLSTWLYTKIKFSILTYIRDEENSNNRVGRRQYDDNLEDHSNNLHLRLRDMSDEARVVVFLILEDRKYIHKNIGISTPQTKIYKRLRKELKWSLKKIIKVEKELQDEFGKI